MARDKEQGRIRYGICLNDEDGCEMSKPIDKKKGKPVQQVRGSRPFVCSKCGEELKEVPAPKTTNWGMIGGIVAAVVVLGAGGAFLALRDKTPKPPVEQGTKEKIPTPVNDPAGKGEIKSTAVLAESLTFMEKDMNLEVGQEKQLNIDCNPGNTNEDIIWSSSNETIATVSPGGIVTGVAGGQATITAKGAMSSVSTSIVANVKGGNKGGETTVGETTGVVTKDLGYAIWTGKMKNGKPHDVQGTLKFTAKHVIDSRDDSKRTASPGEKVIGTFEDGHLTQGKWYKLDGNVESIILGGL